jgi:AcrR family transcriptional regulator
VTYLMGMAKPRNRIRTNDPVGLRNRLLDAAADAFQSAGYGATSIHDLIRTTGVTGGALHHHFPSKKSLALAVIDERIGAEVASTWIARVRDAPTAAAGILSVFESVADALDGQGSVGGCPLGNMASELARGDDELRSALASRYADWRDAIVAKIEADIAVGRAAYAADDPAGFADVAIALFTGALTIGKAEQSTKALRAVARQLRMWMAADL